MTASTRSAQTGRAVVFAAAIGGIAVCLYLVQEYVLLFGGAELDGGLCDVSETFNCEATARSSFANVLGFPLPAIGLAFHTGVLLLLALSLRAPAEGAAARAAAPPAVLTSLFGLAVAYSVFLGAVSVLVIGSLCPACLLLYAANAVGLAGAWIWERRGPHATIAAQVRHPGAVIGAPPAIAFVAVQLAGTIGITLYMADQARDVAATMPPPQTAGFDIAEVRGEQTTGRGPEDAPVVIVSYSDFECPFCARLAHTLDELGAELPDAVRIVFRHVPLPFPATARPAALAAICADEQGRFWEVHDAFFDNQRSLGEDGIRRLAEQAGADLAALDACLASERPAARLAADEAAAAALGIEGTPTFFVNDVQLVGALPLEQIRAVVEAERAEAR